MRLASLLVLVLWALLSNLPARADTYPSRFIRMVVPYPAGGTSDVLARVLARKMGDSMGQQIVIENIGGAAGTIGAGSVARAEPDGYTLIFGYATQFTIAPVLYQNLTYDPLRSFVPIGSAVRFHFLMTAYSGLPVNSLADVVSYAKANPGKLTFASPGVGTSTHLLGELFKLNQGVDIVHVPYKGGGPAITDYVAGRIDLYSDAIAPLLPWVQQGKIKPLAVTSKQRVPELPNVSTVAETGMPDLAVFTWTAVFAPAGTPKPITDRLETELQKALADPEVEATFRSNGYEMFPGSPATVTELIKTDLARWTALAKATGLKMD
ncbi:MAG: tripartite tricarboxylate transporter substrate binding protein [Xanthobacteraceae bacterium]